MRRREGLAALFAEDVLSLGSDALTHFGHGADVVAIPITIPVDANGVVVVSAAPPELADPHARRQPARMDLARTGAGLRIGLAFEAGRHLRLPGVGATGRPAPAELGTVAFDVTAVGMDVTATGTDGEPLVPVLDETTARQLATALLLTFRGKLTRAEKYP